MVRRADPRQMVGRDGPGLFDFLVRVGFAGPEETADGIVYRRLNMTIVIRFSGGIEPVVDTSVRITPRDGSPPAWASLECLYVASALGVLQDVPGVAHNQKVTPKRLRQHAEALRRLLPHLVSADGDELVHRCQGQLLPEGPPLEG